MIPFIAFIRDLILSKYHGWIHIQFRGEEGIIHIDKIASKDIKPFKSGWEKPIPE